MGKPKASEIIIELKAENKVLQAKLDDSSERIKKLEASTKKSGNGMGSVFSKLGMMAKAYIGIEAVKYVTNLAGQVDAAGDSFRGLAAQAEGGADGLLKAMRVASRGTVSDLEIMKSSNLAFQLMGDKVAEHLPKMMEIARAAAKTQGGNIQQMFSDLVVATGRQSVMILDNLGISSATASKYIEEYARNLGKTRDKLTDTEKSQAFFYATMKAGGEIMDKVGADALTLSDRIQRFNADNATTAEMFSAELTPALNNFLDLLHGSSEKINTDSDSFFSISRWGKAAARDLNLLSAVIELLGASWDTLVNELKATGAAFKVLADTKSLSKFWEALKSNSKEVANETTKNFEIIIAKYDKLEEEIQKGSKARKKTPPALPKSPEVEQVKVSAEEMRKIRDKEMQEQIAYLEYTGQLKEAALMQEKLNYEQISNLNSKIYKDKAAMNKSFEEKKVLSAQAANNKIKQSDLDLARAKLKLDTVEYQSAKEQFAASSSLMQSKNKFLFNLGKALSYATAVMNAAESITKIWAVWGAQPWIAAAFTGISAAATGVQIAQIKETKLPSYQRGHVPMFQNGFVPADHYPAMIGAKEAVINERSTIANSGLLKAINDNPGKSFSGSNVIVNQNISGNVLSKDFIVDHVLPELQNQARYAGKHLFAERR